MMVCIELDLIKLVTKPFQKTQNVAPVGLSLKCL